MTYDEWLATLLPFEAKALTRREIFQAGAGDRETALRWIMDASDCDGDWEFLCFHHHLPYGYFKQSVDLCAQV